MLWLKKDARKQQVDKDRLFLTISEVSLVNLLKIMSADQFTLSVETNVLVRHICRDEWVSALQKCHRQKLINLIQLIV